MGKLRADEALRIARGLYGCEWSGVEEQCKADAIELARWVVSVLGERATPPLRVNRGEHGSIILSAHHPKMDGSHVKAMMTVYGARRLAAELLEAADAAEDRSDG